MKLALVGFGDLGIYIRDTLADFDEISENSSVYFDDNLFETGHPCARPFNDYMNDSFAGYDFYMGIGYKHLELKTRIIKNLLDAGRNVPSFIHPSAYVHPSVKVGKGCFIYPGCSIDRNVIIGNGVWIANADVIPHDCRIEEGCWFGANVVLSGKVSIKKCTFIGSGTVVSNEVEIGKKVIIGIGSVITKNVDDGLSVIGNPMKILEKPIRLT